MRGENSVKVTESLILPFLPPPHPAAFSKTLNFLDQLYSTSTSLERWQKGAVLEAEDAFFSRHILNMRLREVKADPLCHAYFRSQNLINPRQYLICFSSNKKTLKLSTPYC